MICIRKTLAVVAVALALVACVTLVSDDGDAAIRTSESGFTYTSSQGIASITGYTGNDEVVIIPETIDSFPVQAINDRAFQNLSIKEVYIPACVTSIGEYAFLSCSNLEYVTICGSATIGLSAFDGCNSIKLIDIQKEPVSIGADAFNLKSTQTCTYRAPESVSLSEYGGDTVFKHVSQSMYLVRYSVTGQVPDDMADLGFAVKSTGDKIEIPEAAVRHGYDIEVKNGEEILDLDEFTVTDSDLSITLSYTYTLFSIDFVVDGNVYEHYDLFYNDPITLPEAPTKETDAQFIYSFKEWDGYTTGMTVTDDVSFNAVFNETLREYTVQFQSDGKIIQSTVMKYGDVIVPPEDPEKTTEEGIDYRFSGWAGYTSGMTVTGNVIFDALFVKSNHEYTIKFLVDGEVVDEQKLLYGNEIVPPEDPVKETANGIQYTFAGWENFTPGMTVTDDASFNALFDETPVDEGTDWTMWAVVAVVIIAILIVVFIFFKRFR